MSTDVPYHLNSPHVLVHISERYKKWSTWKLHVQCQPALFFVVCSNCSEKEDQFDNEKDQNEAEENEDVNGEEGEENKEEEENTEDINEEDDDEEDRLSGEVR